MKCFRLLLMLAAFSTNGQVIASPNLATPGVPSAFTAQWGDYYAWAAGYSFDDIIFNDKKQRKEKDGIDSDVAIGAGFGIGSPDESVSLEVGVGTTGFQSKYQGGLVDLRIGRNIVNNDSLRFSVGGGVLNAVAWGNADKNAAVYGVATVGTLLGERPLQISLGIGNGDERVRGVFGGAGIGITDTVGLSAGWDGRGLTSALSLKIKPDSPWNFAVNGINITDSGRRGRALVLSISYGSSFRSFSPIN